MKDIISLLKEKNIISNEEINLLKQNLMLNHPEYSNLKKAQVFADAVHHRLDTSLSPFDLSLRKKIKFTLLKNTIHREDFSINAYDVFNSYEKSETDYSASINELTSFINQFDTISINIDEVSALLEFDSSLNTPVECDITPIIDEPVSKLSYLLSFIKKPKFILTAAPLICILIASVILLYSHMQNSQYTAAFTEIPNPEINCPLSLEVKMCTNYLQEDLQYKDIDTAKLKKWLTNKNSLLAEEPYFTAIMEAGKEFNVNPLLLFSITGQEQGFVPKTNQFAEEIANNPFNVYGSWEEYNTDIYKSSKIAAETLIHLGKGCPEGADQIKWINNQYAEDPGWHEGVSYFFSVLSDVALTDN